jgi:hypothetical protein
MSGPLSRGVTVEVGRQDANPAIASIHDRDTQYFTISGGDYAIVARDAGLRIGLGPIRIERNTLDPSQLQFALGGTAESMVRKDKTLASRSHAGAAP